MAADSTGQATKRCVNCGFEAPAGSDDWGSVDHQPLGTLTRCPECGSTNILRKG